MNMNRRIIRSAISSMPSVGIIKLLKDYGFTVIGSDIISDSAARYFVDDFFLVKKSTKEFEKEVIGRYIEKVRAYNVSWIISGPENEINLLASHEDEFINYSCCLFHPPVKTLAIITDKYLLSEKLDKVIPQKRNCLLRNYNEVKSFRSNKVIIKPRRGRGSNGVLVINNDINKLRQFSCNSDIDEFMVQEFIPGREFSVDLLCDNEGKLLNAVIRERMQVDSGIATVAKTVRNEKILEYIVKVTDTFLFRGFNCIQFKEENNEFYLTDINPRIGGGSILSFMSSSCMTENFVNMLQLDFDKLRYSNFDFEEKVMYRYYNEVYA